MSGLNGVRIKIARANEHMKELERRLQEFRASHPYPVVVETDSQTGDQLWKVGDHPAQLPDLPVMGDILYNLRSALDHLAWQLVLKAGSIPTSSTEFPIFNDPARFGERRAQTKMLGMNQPMKDRIKSHQPCFGKNPNRNDALWGLQEYGNTDKHRTLLIVAVSTQDMLWEPGVHPGVHLGAPISIHKGPVYKDTVLARFPVGQYQSKFYAVPSIAFNEPPLSGEDVHYKLSFMQFVVESIVNEFDSEFF